VGYYLVAAGITVAAFGVMVTFRDGFIVAPARWAPIAETTIGALAPPVGLLLIASGVFLVREQGRRIRDELDHPGPANISNPRTIRIDGTNACIWRSESFGSRPGVDVIIELCKKHLSPTDLHFVAYYTAAGECVFYVDVLDDDLMDHYDVDDTPERRRQYELQGRHIRYLTGKLDKRLRPLESGILVRVVLDVQKGAIFYYNLETDGFLIGVTLDQGQVDQADRKLSILANDVLVRRGRRPNDDFYRN
jgi:hypothetical protein